VTLFRRARSIIAESLWYDGHGAMHWCDIDVGSLHRSPLAGSVDGSDDEVQFLAPPVSAFQPTGHGYVFAGENTVGVIGAEGGDIRELARVDHGSDRLRFNEAKCDPFGRFVVGTMNLDSVGDGAIYSVAASGEVRSILGGIGVSNGFEWSEDGRQMWFTDTSTQTIYAADYSETGELSQIRSFIHGRMSDGLARDADGGFWNGIYDCGHVVHWNSRGEPDLEFDVPAGHVTSVAFGGEELSTLFIATARENMTEEQLRDQPLTGSIFQVETSTRGFCPHEFGAIEGGL
jgi:sugar lactone lactonase YvrE